jgi:hypothetical protein
LVWRRRVNRTDACKLSRRATRPLPGRLGPRVAFELRIFVSHGVRFIRPWQPAGSSTFKMKSPDRTPPCCRTCGLPPAPAMPVNSVPSYWQTTTSSPGLNMAGNIPLGFQVRPETSPTSVHQRGRLDPQGVSSLQCFGVGESGAAQPGSSNSEYRLVHFGMTLPSSQALAQDSECED